MVPNGVSMANWTARRLGTRPLKNKRKYMKTYRILILSNDSIRSESDQIESSLRFVLGTEIYKKKQFWHVDAEFVYSQLRRLPAKSEMGV